MLVSASLCSCIVPETVSWQRSGAGWLADRADQRRVQGQSPDHPAISSAGAPRFVAWEVRQWFLSFLFFVFSRSLSGRCALHAATAGQAAACTCRLVVCLPHEGTCGSALLQGDVPHEDCSAPERMLRF